MHPEVKEFWEHHYKKDIIENISPRYYYISPLGNKNGIIILAMSFKVAEVINNDNTDLSKFDTNKLVYLWEGLHTENEMLKRIKLINFL